MDVLADVMAAAKVGGVLTSHIRADAPWGFAVDDAPFASFHAVAQGTCWLRRPGAEPVQLVAGDVALLPVGGGHGLASHPRGRLARYDDILEATGATLPGAQVELAGGGPRTTLICGAYPYDTAVVHPLLAILPPLLHVPARHSPAHSGLNTTLRLLAAELETGEPGAQTVVDRLVDVLFVHLIRAWLADYPTPDASWLTALRDPEIASAISLLHARPADPWTVAGLAAAVRLSRATLARRFTALVGEPPLAYLTRWRMELAARRLRDGSEPVASIAAAVGYTSEFAFTRAFARARGMPPGRYRTSHRGTEIRRHGAATPGV